MLHSRLVRLLTVFSTDDKMKTGDELAELMQVSERTIRSDLKALNQELVHHGGEINAIRGQGYRLEITDEPLFGAFIQEQFRQQRAGIHTAEDRVRYIIHRLLLTEDYLKAEQLAEELYVSFPTIQNDLKKVNQIIKRSQLELIKRPRYGMKLSGSETAKRYFMAAYFREAVQEENKFDTLPDYIATQKEAERIEEQVYYFVRQHDVILSDIAIQNLIMHIAIACQRIRNKNYVNLPPKDMAKIVQQQEFQIASQLMASLEQELALFFPQAEVAYITVHLMGTKWLAENESDTILPEGNMLELAEAFVSRIDDQLHLQLVSDRELLVNIALHLKPAIHRHSFHMNVRNPLLHQIKRHYPVAFEAAIIGACVLEERLEIQIVEDEIGYLALHIGAAMERNREHRSSKSRCIIVCASGAGSAKLLQYKLESLFSKSIEIVETVELYRLPSVDESRFDFIVSTLPIKEKHSSKPVVRVNVIMEEKDIAAVRSFLQERLPAEGAGYLREDLVFLQQGFSSKQEVLAFLTEKLDQKNLVEGGFLSSVYAREEMSPTSFGNLVAIPHPLEPQTAETFWTICTLKHAIDWDGKPVRFVCLLCVEKDSQDLYTEMYKQLVRIIEDKVQVEKLLKARDYRSFKREIEAIHETAGRA